MIRIPNDIIQRHLEPFIYKYIEIQYKEMNNTLCDFIWEKFEDYKGQKN